ncbi:nitric oxide-associated protein 1 isoform X2 [Lasioglossum baleicum]|uniref:nitric oxide-associated protein 1 isoform X2 n=1 Tax=Lasioglossum baleicum TaxID=434251 RepID=UPI003FCE6296
MYVSKISILTSQLKARKILCNIKLYHAEQAAVKPKVHRNNVDPSVLRLRDKLLYCDYLDLETAKVGYYERKENQMKTLVSQRKANYNTSYEKPVSSIIVDKEYESIDRDANNNEMDTENETSADFSMPHTRTNYYETVDSPKEDLDKGPSDLLNPKYKELYEKYLEAKQSGSNDTPKFQDIVKNELAGSLPKGELWKVPQTWMTDFEQFNDSLVEKETFQSYGTPDPTSKLSSINCGGCGALLHCIDPLMPGYLPLELFSGGNKEDLKRTVCQRCHFLKTYNAALHVKVSIDDYPELLKVIKRKKCAMILIVDLTDFPCSIWPDLKSIMHPFTPIVLVGNKVDLLPRDCPTFLDNVKNQLVDTVVNVTGIKRENVMHATLASAKTGYGIEQLINKLQHMWKHRGDVYLVGCTNVGKSTMFNTLINSDYCKVQAVDLVQRATISPWPGTTLNLLKFPILNPQPRKLLLRTRRLMEERIYKHAEIEYRSMKFRKTRNIRYATLQDEVGRTFDDREDEDDPFSQKPAKFLERTPCFDESQPEYAQSRWCYDTPGTIQRDQVLDLLTTDELALTVPTQTISPRTFILRPKETMFVAGMGRLDFLKGNVYIRY